MFERFFYSLILCILIFCFTVCCYLVRGKMLTFYTKNRYYVLHNTKMCVIFAVLKYSKILLNLVIPLRKMKETVHVNIGSCAFTIDEDAYRVLRDYFEDIRRRLPEDDETLADIEARMAEIFQERISSPMRVISLEMVRTAMAQMGAPSDFGERIDDGAQSAETTPQPRKLYRSRSDRSIAGICGGLGAFFGVESTMVRLLTVLFFIFGGLSLWAYIILWIVLPEEPVAEMNINGTKKH